MDNWSKLDEIQRCLSSLQSGRELLRSLLQDITERLDKEELVPSDVWDSLVNAGSGVLELQQICLEKAGTEARPGTYAELSALLERRISEIRQSLRTEQARQAVAWFLDLQCTEEAGALQAQINEELQRCRAAARELLDGSFDEAERLQRAQPYQLVREVFTGQYAEQEDPFQEIAAAFGIAISFALTRGYLEWSGSEAATAEPADVAVVETGDAAAAEAPGGTADVEAVGGEIVEPDVKAAEVIPAMDTDAADTGGNETDHGDQVDGVAADAAAEQASDPGTIDQYPPHLCLKPLAERYERVSRPRTGGFSVNKFERELKEMSRLGKAAAMIVHVAMHGVLSDRMMHNKVADIVGDDSGSVRMLFDRLVRRGYFDAHTVATEAEEDTLYTISAHARSIFERKGARDVLDRMTSLKWEPFVSLWDVPDDPEQASVALLRLRTLDNVMGRMEFGERYFELARSNDAMPYRLWRDTKQDADAHLLIVCGDLQESKPWHDAGELELLFDAVLEQHEGVRGLVVTSQPGSYWSERLREMYGIPAWQVWSAGDDGLETDAEVEDAALRELLKFSTADDAEQADSGQAASAHAEAAQDAADEDDADDSGQGDAPTAAAGERAAEDEGAGGEDRQPESAVSVAESRHAAMGNETQSATDADRAEEPDTTTAALADEVVRDEADEAAEQPAAPEPQPDAGEQIQLESAVLHALQLLSEGRKAEGMALLHALSHDPEWQHSGIDVLRDKVSFALFDPLFGSRDRDRHELLDTPVDLEMLDSVALEDWLAASMCLRLFFDPDSPNDYRLRNRWSQLETDQSNAVLNDIPAVKQLIRHFWEFVDRHGVGIKFCTSRAARNQLDISRALEDCRSEIRELLDTAFPRNVKNNFNHNRVHLLAVQLYQTHTGEVWQLLDRAFDMPLAELREVCREFTVADLDSLLEPEIVTPDDGRLDDYLQQRWNNIKLDRDKKEPLMGKYRTRMMNWLREAVTPLLYCYALRSFMELSSTRMPIGPEMVTAAQNRTLELIDTAQRQLEDAAQPATAAAAAGQLCMREALKQIRGMMNPESEWKRDLFYAPLLLGEYVELNENMLPVFDHEWLDPTMPVKGVRLWERLMKQTQLPLYADYREAAEKALRNYDIGQYERLVNVLGEAPHSEELIRETSSKVQQLLKHRKEDFLTEVEIAQNYGQLVSNDEMLGYIRLAEAAEKHVRDHTRNVGFYNRFLAELHEQIRRGSDRRMKAMKQRQETLKRDIMRNAEIGVNEEDVLAEWPILGKIERMLEERNMTVAEDYIQLASSGQKDMPLLQESEDDIYHRFENMYQVLYNACNMQKSYDLVRVYNQGVRNILFPNQNNRNTENAERFIRQWHKSKHIADFMGLLMSQKIERVKPGRRQDEFHVYPAPRDAKLAQYPHPIAAFGTKAVQSGLRVILLAGIRTADNILDEVAARGKGPGSATIVLLDYALSLADRRMLAKTIKLRSMTEEVVVVVDRVMALFLAGFPDHDRVGAFLAAALPSSKVKPYASSGRGAIPPEMFIGRTKELAEMQDMNGPVFVYGGRQLGKTALLLETRNREHDPKNGCHAIYVDLRNLNTTQSLAKICDELVRERVLDKPCDSWDGFKTQIRERLTGGSQPLSKLMLLLDEADAFLEDCERLGNRPLELLKELRDLVSGQFKFVLAGLRDVVRFNKRRLGGNSVLAHLGHITIRPLDYLDARDLLLRPLHYVGFRLNENSESLISLILAKTNYYPGLIHFYCQKLIDTIADSYRKGIYNENASPPYALDENHIKTLLGQKDFLSEIENRFQITLQLDTDNQYDILAKAMAYHYYEQGIGQGASARDLHRICSEFGIGKIANLPIDSVQALMEEMAELNIFSLEASGSEKYVFNRYSFFQMVGNDDQVFEQLYAYGDES